MLNIRNFSRKFKKISTSSVQFTSLSTQGRTFKEVSIKVPWGQVAGKWWEPFDKRPVLSIHGWQDNCQTFDRLLPHLYKDVGFLAIDLPGHGYSSRLPPGMYYHFTNYVILIRHLRRYFEWQKVSLMGHSLGGIISYVYSMLYPQDVDFLVCIDAFKPMIRQNRNIGIANAINDFLKYNDHAFSSNEPPSYTLEEMRQKVAVPNKNSVMYEYTDILLKRNIAPSRLHPGKYYFTRDPRLKTGGLLNFSQKELVQYAELMEMPIFITKTTLGPYYEPKENVLEVLEVLKRSSRDCDFHYLEGTHHIHLNTPDELGRLIAQFMQRYNTEDRSIGGINDDIISVNRKSNIAVSC